MRPDDAFWAARIVARFSDAAIRGIVEKARYSDPRATDYITATLIKRRDKVLRTWLAGANPIVDPVLSADGALTFRNAAVDAGVAAAPPGYRASWARFDNTTRELQVLGDTTAAGTRLAAPALPEAPGAFVRVAIAATEGANLAWRAPVHAYFRRTDTGWSLVGFERLPDPPDR
jgi:hypothetical protein